MLPQRIVTIVLSAHSEMATLLSFPILGMSFKSVLNNTEAGWCIGLRISVNCCKSKINMRYTYDVSWNCCCNKFRNKLSY